MLGANTHVNVQCKGLKLVIASEIKRHKLDLYLEKEIIDKNTCDDVMHIYWHSAEFKGN